ncbi:MAG: isopenicillin N synthase family dioxygenase [Bacteroidia bacterium]
MTSKPEIPVIDISPLREKETDTIAAAIIAQQINTACREHGFFYISGHGVSEELQEKIESLSHEFFKLPEEEKLKISMQLGGKAWRGFFSVGGELTSGKPDIKEGIYFGTELDQNNPQVLAGTPMHGQNLFPEKPEELRETVLQYIDEVTQIGHVVMKAVALSLSLDSDYFYSRYTKDPLILFRIFHYPGQVGITNPDQLNWGVGEHTDYGLLTILKQDAVGGLQVKSRGQWIEAPPLENTFICNIGDMLDRMTGGLYRSTPHRVLNKSGKSRLSFPLFFDPGFDTIPKRIETLSRPTEDDSAERWDKANVHSFEGTYGDYILNKVSKVFPELKRNVL